MTSWSSPTSTITDTIGERSIVSVIVLVGLDQLVVRLLGQLH